jgi:hypothetical protein
MTTASRRWLSWAVLVVAGGLLVASIAWASSARHNSPYQSGYQPWGPGMMGSGGSAGGSGPVNDMGDARRAAARFGDRWGLTVGEVLQFDRNYYAELAEPNGRLATEVLVSPHSGIVRFEYGPAMMWNTRYGMHRFGDAAPQVSRKDARVIADEWLARHRRGETAASPDVFPGYYTLHTMRRSKVTGMLSVNATTGDVWYHSWHGRFVAMDEPDGD